VDKRLTAVEIGITEVQRDIKEIKPYHKAVQGFLQRDQIVSGW